MLYKLNKGAIFLVIYSYNFQGIFIEFYVNYDYADFEIGLAGFLSKNLVPPVNAGIEYIITTTRLYYLPSLSMSNLNGSKEKVFTNFMMIMII